MTVTITMDETRLQQLRRLLADKLAAGDADAIDFLTWLDAHVGRLRDEDQ
jgi:hypothetical protein